MPDHLDANGFVILDPDDQHADITRCQLCDNHGYRGTTVCDHHDHYATTANGRAAVAAELDRIRNRRNHTRGAIA